MYIGDSTIEMSARKAKAPEPAQKPKTDSSFYAKRPERPKTDPAEAKAKAAAEKQAAMEKAAKAEAAKAEAAKANEKDSKTGGGGGEEEGDSDPNLVSIALVVEYCSGMIHPHTHHSGSHSQSQ